MKTQVVTVIVFLAILLGCDLQQPKESPRATPVVLADTMASPVRSLFTVYGFPVDSNQYVKGRIRWNQTLSVLLDDYNVSSEKLAILARESRKTYDVRKLKAGKEYVILHEGDSVKTVNQFVFEPDNRSYVVYNFKDSVYAQWVQRPVEVVEKEVSGIINSSVYQSVLDAGASPELVNRMVDIFAWQVDFFRINKGDRFKVIYKEEQVGGEPVGISSITAAYFKHYDKDYYAIQYGSDINGDYFDEEGNSLRKTFLRSPLKFYRITSRYSGRRFHPVQKRYKAHLGTDYAAPTGTEIRTVGDGVVLEARYHKYNGNFVKIRHNSNYTTQYLHMSKIRSGIRPGVKVKQGQTIGYVGSTGLANGPHVCYRFWKNGRQVDALKVDLPPSEPLDPSKLATFLHIKNQMIHRLDLVEYEESKILLANVSK